MELKNFIDIHAGEKILVLGNGQSILELPKKINVTTIGVNDIEKHITPTYLLITDKPDRFGLSGTRRRLNIERSKARYVFVSDKGWEMQDEHRRPQNYKRVVYSFGNKGGTSYMKSDSLIDFSIISPYVAICLAIKMGAKEIGVLGVDFTNGHFYSPNDGQHPLIKSGLLPQLEEHLSGLNNYAKQNGISIWNLSEQSVIKTLQKKKLQDFLC